MGDMADSIVPRSDQLNAEDLLSGPRTVTITDVRVNDSADQPVHVYTQEFGRSRPFKPSKTVRRLMVVAWGDDSTAYAGRRMTLYRDPAVRFGGMDVGGIRVSHMDGIREPLHVALTVSKGRRAPYTVDPLTDGQPAGQRTGSLDDRAAGMVNAFAALGVEPGEIEHRIGRPRAGWSDDDLDAMGDVWRAMRAGNLSREEAFPRTDVTADDLPADPGPSDQVPEEEAPVHSPGPIDTPAAISDLLDQLAVDEPDRLPLLSLYVTRPIHSIDDLTDNEADTVTAALETIAGQPADDRAADLDRDLSEARELAGQRDPQ